MVLGPIKVVDIELSQPLTDLEGLGGYIGAQGLVRLHGVPIGYIHVPVIAGRCEAATLSKRILAQHQDAIIRQLLHNGLAMSSKPDELRLEDLFDIKPPSYTGEWPLVTVAVCTRDRPADLNRCLEALNCLDYPNLEILVIDNAPTSDATQQLVRTQYPHVCYACEPRPGLDWARNRAILEAKGEIIAYTDDDVVVDPGWVKALAQTFVENPEVMAVTGLVVPYELETQAQILFEMNGGFGRGFERKWYRVNRGDNIPWYLRGTGNFGTGANMAYRRCLFDEIGGFDPALDVGTVTNGSGDLEMFFRVIKAGHTLVYDPSALIRHCHRREYARLRSQLLYNGSAFSYFVCAVMAYPKEFPSFVRLALSWLISSHLRRLFISYMHPTRFPRDLLLAELWGCILGLGRYQQARKIAVQIAEDFEALPGVECRQTLLPKPIPQLSKIKKISDDLKPVGVRTLELTQPLQALTDVTDYFRVRFFVTWNNSSLGCVDVVNQYQQISATRLRQVIVEHLNIKLLKAQRNFTLEARWLEAAAALRHRYTSAGDSKVVDTPTPLPQSISASILVGTCDRPNDLRNCLRCLTTQQSPRRVEVIVVDNNPTSGLTSPVVAEFPGVILVNESRKGVAYARNAGIAVSTGDIVVTTDDDVTMSPQWLETLIEPFARADVMAVTGNILPVELETKSQRLFEQYGGLGRGFYPFEVNGDWFERSWMHVVPTWELGGTANSAFRASIFCHPKIGLMDEALGPGMPSGVGEDIYLFYKVLQAGYTIVYEPKAYVWHKHRQTLAALRRQLYNYSKGFVSYNLTTLLRDRDFRVLMNLTIHLPAFHLKRIYSRLRGWSNYPISLTLVEVAGNLAGPWSLLQSYWRVQRLGRSAPYIPPSERSNLFTMPELITAKEKSKEQLGEMVLASEVGTIQ